MKKFLVLLSLVLAVIFNSGCFKKIASPSPNDSVAYYNRGNASFELEEYNKAIEDFTKARDLAKKAGDEKLVADAQKAIDAIQ